MASGRRKVSARREPVFASANQGADLRDRPGAGDESDRPRARRGAAKENSRQSGGRTESRSEKSGAKQRRKGGGSGGRSLFGRLLYWGFVLGLWGIIAAIGAIAWIGAHLPAIQSLEVPKRPPSIQVVGTDGRPLATRGDLGAIVTLKELPAYVPQAFIAIEDRRFYEHHGVDPIGVTRAVVANVLRRGVSQGGSTITQQLAKNLFLTPDRTLTRKIQEAVLALWLERKFSKSEILDLYLNRIYFGAGAYGIEAAAQRYFGKSAQKLSLAEAATLAGIVKSPSRLSPSRNPDGAERRAQTVLGAMIELKFVGEEKAKAALANPAHALKQAGQGSANYVGDWILDVLDDLVGHVEQDIVVETTIDPVLQANAEKALVEELNQKGDKFGVTQGAIVAMTPNGDVRAMVGGRNYAESQFNRAVAAKRQPGSAFKPFVYLTAIERGLTPDTVREDKPISLKGWKPENYSKEYFGPVTLTQALAHSLNTVSVRLTLEFGPTAVVRTAHRLGIASKLDPNPSIALGTSEVSVIEMVGAFAPFANGGMSVTPHVVQRVRGADGKTLYTRPPIDLGRIIEPRYVAMMNQMMQETLLTGTARKAEVPGWAAAGKTGTSQDFRDAWFLGYTSHLVAGVWLGNDDNSPTKKMTGGGLPVEVWSRFMRTAHQRVPVAGLPGLSGGLPSIFAPFTTGSAPASQAPPAPIAPRTEATAAPRANSLDNWFIDTLFGKRH